MVAEAPRTPGAPPPRSKPPRKPRVLVFYNYSGLSAAAEVPEPPAGAVDEVAGLLKAQGYEVSVFNAEDDCDRMGDAVILVRPDLVLNLVDHFHGDTLLAGSAAGLLEIFEFPFVGGDSLCTSSCQDRLRTHLMLSHAGVPCTAFVPIWDRGELPDYTSLRFPLILTQAFDDVYHRADARPLLANVDELEEHAAEILPEYDLPFMLEEYAADRRLSIIVAGDQVLPPCEIWPGEEGGWLIDVADLEGAGEQVGDIARRAARIMGCRDWAQIDMVMTEGGLPLVTDVRPVPALWLEHSPFRVAASSFEGGAAAALGLAVESGLARAKKLLAAEIAEAKEAEEAEKASGQETPTENGAPPSHGAETGAAPQGDGEER